MKILSISIFDKKQETCFRLAHVEDLSSFNFFTKSHVKEYILFFTRTCCERTNPGVRQTINMNNIPYVCHTYVGQDGLSGTVITDKDYPVGTAFSLLHKELQGRLFCIYLHKELVFR
jgi:synaptobrevin family protein YKT6